MKLSSLFGMSLIGFALLAAGCGSSNPSAKLPGAKIFASAGCASCHTLKAANAKGQIGPDLDALKPDAPTVSHQVRVGGNGMPSFRRRLSGTQISQVAAFVAAASRTTGQASAFKPDDTTVKGCEQSNKPFCFRQAFANIAYKDGPAKALALLATDDSRMPSVHGDCHQIAHAVGHAGLARYHGNAAEALAHGGMTCNSGYYHGVIERSFSGLPRSEVIHKARHLCTTSSVTKDDFLLYQCVHGLGHGLMIYSGDDLPWALRACHKLQTSFDRVSCTGGVFMQNLDTGMITSRFLSKKNPIYPCPIVAQADKVYCYLMVTSRINTLDGYNWKRTAGWCRRERAGLGRDVLPVVRARRLGGDAVPPGADDPPLRARRQRRARVHLRRLARLREQLCGRPAGDRALQPGAGPLPRLLLRRRRHDSRRDPPARPGPKGAPATRPCRRATAPTATAAPPSSSVSVADGAARARYPSQRWPGRRRPKRWLRL